MSAITPTQLLAAYAHGYFPMAESRDGAELHWYFPKWRGVLPLHPFHVPKSLRRFLNKTPFTYTADTAFREVMLGCADRESTWINSEILELYTELHRLGFAHSIECREEGELVGGVYGVALGGAFFAESMFSRRPNASKAALAELARRLARAGYALLDAQYINDHLLQFGAQEISCRDYLVRLRHALTLAPKDAFTD